MNIYDEIKTERHAQDEQWGGAEHDDQHSPGEFMAFITLQIEKSNKDGSDVRDRFVKIAALSVAAVESLDRQTLDYGSDDRQG